MPYIQSHARMKLLDRAPKTAGEVAYLLFKWAVETWIKQRKFDTIVSIFNQLEQAKRKYSIPEQLKDKIGDLNIQERRAVIECVKLEFYLRYAYPYETVKRMQNGDV